MKILLLLIILTVAGSSHSLWAKPKKLSPLLCGISEEKKLIPCKSEEELLEIKHFLFAEEQKGIQVLKTRGDLPPSKLHISGLAILAAGKTAVRFLSLDASQAAISTALVEYANLSHRALALVRMAGVATNIITVVEISLYSGDAAAPTLSERFSDWNELHLLLSLDDQFFMQVMKENTVANLNLVATKKMYMDALNEAALSAAAKFLAAQAKSEYEAKQAGQR